MNKKMENKLKSQRIKRPAVAALGRGTAAKGGRRILPLAPGSDEGRKYLKGDTGKRMTPYTPGGYDRPNSKRSRRARFKQGLRSPF